MGLIRYLMSGDSRRSLKKLDKTASAVEALAPKYAARKEEKGQGGGYTRIYKLGERKGDAAEMAVLELID